MNELEKCIGKQKLILRCFRALKPGSISLTHSSDASAKTPGNLGFEQPTLKASWTSSHEIRK